MTTPASTTTTAPLPTTSDYRWKPTTPADATSTPYGFSTFGYFSSPTFTSTPWWMCSMTTTAPFSTYRPPSPPPYTSTEDFYGTVYDLLSTPTPTVNGGIVYDPYFTSSTPPMSTPPEMSTPRSDEASSPDADTVTTMMGFAPPPTPTTTPPPFTSPSPTPVVDPFESSTPNFRTISTTSRPEVTTTQAEIETCVRENEAFCTDVARRCFGYDVMRCYRAVCRGVTRCDVVKGLRCGGFDGFVVTLLKTYCPKPSECSVV